MFGIIAILASFLLNPLLFLVTPFKNQERIKGTEKASPIHTLFHR